MRIVTQIIYVAHMVTFYEASQCRNSQHCSDCTDLGICLTECEQGYFDKYCSSSCSRNCQNHTCKATRTGIGKCTMGCIPGFRGDNCNRPCTETGSVCRRCQGQCGGGYCYHRSSCVSGCFHSYYGSSCRNCSSRCKTCNMITGTCEECLPSYLKCEDTCKHCLGPCEGECVNECPSSVNQSMCGNECHNFSKACIHGCTPGWYGTECSSQCTQCNGTRCSNTGACLDGCNAGYFGPYCRSCPVNCAGGTCDSQNGSCVIGCMKGYYGDKCDHSCDTCADGVCDQTGGCLESCISESCTTGVLTTDAGINSTNPETKSSGYLVYLIISLLAVQIISVSACLCYICYRKGMATQRESRSESIHLASISPQEPAAPAVDYQPLHRYYEIRDEDMDTVEHVAPPPRPANPEGGLNRLKCEAPPPRPANPEGGLNRLKCVAPPLRLANPEETMERLECVAPSQKLADPEGALDRLKCVSSPQRQEEEGKFDRLECVSPTQRSARPEGAIDRVECLAPPQRPVTSKDDLGNVAVLADIFQPAADTDNGADAASGSSTRESHTYTHLMTSVRVDDQANYISPTESESDQYE